VRSHATALDRPSATTAGQPDGADLYAELFAFAVHRKDVRDNRLRTIRYPPEGEAAIQTVLDSYQPPQWFTFHARVLAFGSEAVSDAVVASRDTDNRIWPAWQARTDAKQAAAADPAGDGAQAAARLTEESKKLAEADKADAVLVQAIRDELHIRPHRNLWQWLLTRSALTNQRRNRQNGPRRLKSRNIRGD
jgi:hypothetical protein